MKLNYKRMLTLGIIAFSICNAFTQEWEIQLIDSVPFLPGGGEGFYGIDIIKDSKGNRHFSAGLLKDDSDGVCKPRILYGKNRGNGWEIDSVMEGGYPNWLGHPTSIAFNSDQNPVIFSLQGQVKNKHTLFNATQNGDDWDISVVADNVYAHDAICAIGGSPVGCFYYDRTNEWPFYSQYFVARPVAEGWTSNLIVSYDEDETKDYWGFGTPVSVHVPGTIFMMHDVVIPPDKVALISYINNGNGWSEEKIISYPTGNPNTQVVTPFLGFTNDWSVHNWAFGASGDVPSHYFIHSGDGWNELADSDTAFAIGAQEGYPTWRRELHFSENKTSFRLIINRKDLNSGGGIWLQWRTPDNKFGFSSISLNEKILKVTEADFTIFNDTVYILFNCYFNWNTTGLYEAIARVGDIVSNTDNIIIAEESVHFQNYPNPFDISTTMKFNLKKGSHVSLNIINSAGYVICKLADQEYNAGTYEIQWDGKDNNGNIVPSGVYYAQFTTNLFRETQKLISLK